MCTPIGRFRREDLTLNELRLKGFFNAVSLLICTSSHRLLKTGRYEQANTMAPWILGEKFNTVYPHKGSIKALWETKWKFAVSFAGGRHHHPLLSGWPAVRQSLSNVACSVKNPSTHSTTVPSKTFDLFSRSLLM